MVNHASIADIFVFGILLPVMVLVVLSLIISVIILRIQPRGMVPSHPFEILNPFFWIEHRRLYTLVFKKFSKPLDHYGYMRLHEDSCGILWWMPPEKLKPIVARGRSGLLHGKNYNFHWGRRAASREYIVEVKDATSGHTHYLPVPRCGSARQAVAWTFNLAEGQYQPVKET